MATNERDRALRHTLLPLTTFLQAEGLTELVINRPGELWTQIDGHWQRHALPVLDFDYLWGLACLIANYSHQRIDETEPVLSATLPDGERCQIVVPPACTPGTVSLTLRKPSSTRLSLADYEAAGAFAPCVEASPGLGPVERELLALKQQGRYREFIELAVASRQNILISGATGSGKTTFAKAVMQLIPPEERLLSIENVAELELWRTHPNSVALFYSAGGQGVAQVSPQQLMESALRMFPSRIFLAELIRGEEAFYFLRNVNSGHPGSITTMHANSPRLAIEQLVLFIKESAAGATLGRDDIKQLVQMCVDVIIQFKLVNNRRVVTEIYYEPEQKLRQIGG